MLDALSRIGHRSKDNLQMSASKLRTVHVVIIGSFACLVIVVSLYFLVIKKSYARISGLEMQYQQAESVWVQMPTAEAELEAAVRENQSLSVRYLRYMKDKMPPISFEDRAQGMIALWKEQAEVLGPMLQSWPKKSGVRLASAIQVPAAPVDPNVINADYISIPIGNITVSGDFRSILQHIRSWNNFHRLVQVDPVSLTGPSPGMSAQYALTVHIFPYGQAGPNVGMAASGSATAVAGGMP
jgi:hypothetical protein